MRDFEPETYFSKREFRARYHMTASDSQSVTVSELVSMACLSTDVLGDLHLGYTETWGAADLREAIAATYDRKNSENILCFAGAVEAFCESLIEEAGVLLLPASIYRSELLETPVDRFRVGFGRANMDEGLAAFGAFLDQHQNAPAP